MWRNYMTVGVRALVKNKTYAFINIFGLDPLVAILAIAVPFGAICAKVFAEILDETPQHALRALSSTGASPADVGWRGRANHAGTASETAQ